MKSFLTFKVNSCYLIQFVFISVESAGSIWSGPNDRVKEGTFVCPTGIRVTKYSFGLGEPNGGTNENCARLSAASNFDLEDLHCGSNQGILCERDAQ